MTQEKINRINELARKSRVTALSDQELKEQATLRNEYREAFKRSLAGHLENITIIEPDGTKTKVTKHSKNE